MSDFDMSEHQKRKEVAASVLLWYLQRNGSVSKAVNALNEAVSGRNWRRVDD